MHIQEFIDEYAAKTDEELLWLGLHPEQLTPEANTALDAELAKRRINTPAHLEAAGREEQEREAEEARKPGPLFLIHPGGIGRQRYGKAARTYDPTTGIERFRTTFFIVLLWIPLIPTRTCLVERKRGFWSEGEITVLERLPLDWEQVLAVWVVAAAILLAFIWALKLAPRFLY